MAEIAIAIDGPASSGKGTIARAVARALSYQYIDTGAMYRSVAVVARRRGVSWHEEAPLASLAAALAFRFLWGGERLEVEVDGVDLTDAIRADGIGAGASAVSRHPSVRQALLAQQQELGRRGGVVMDGRDIGTVVLPEAQLKIYLDAAVEERARRRHRELVQRGEDVTRDAVLASLRARDRQDMEREVAPLRAADDAVVIDTTHLSPSEAAEVVLELARARGASEGSRGPRPAVDPGHTRR